MERFRDCWIWRGFRSSARRAGIERWNGQRTLRSAVAGGQDSGGALDHGAPSDWEKAPKEIQRSIERKFKYPVFVKPATLDFGGNDESAFAEELCSGVEPGVRIRDESFVERAMVARR